MASANSIIASQQTEQPHLTVSQQNIASSLNRSLLESIPRVQRAAPYSRHEEVRVLSGKGYSFRVLPDGESYAAPSVMFTARKVPRQGKDEKIESSYVPSEVVFLPDGSRRVILRDLGTRRNGERTERFVYDKEVSLFDATGRLVERRRYDTYRKSREGHSEDRVYLSERETPSSLREERKNSGGDTRWRKTTDKESGVTLKKKELPKAVLRELKSDRDRLAASQSVSVRSGYDLSSYESLSSAERARLNKFYLDHPSLEDGASATAPLKSSRHDDSSSSESMDLSQYDFSTMTSDGRPAVAQVGPNASYPAPPKARLLPPWMQRIKDKSFLYEQERRAATSPRDEALATLKGGAYGYAGLGAETALSLKDQGGAFVRGMAGGAAWEGLSRAASRYGPARVVMTAAGPVLLTAYGVQKGREFASYQPGAYSSVWKDAPVSSQEKYDLAMGSTSYASQFAAHTGAELAGFYAGGKAVRGATMPRDVRFTTKDSLGDPKSQVRIRYEPMGWYKKGVPVLHVQSVRLPRSSSLVSANVPARWDGLGRRGEVGGRSARERSGKRSRAELREGKSSRSRRLKYEVVSEVPNSVRLQLRGKGRKRVDEERVLEARFERLPVERARFFNADGVSGVWRDTVYRPRLKSMDIAMKGAVAPRIPPPAGRSRSPVRSQDPAINAARSRPNKGVTEKPPKGKERNQLIVAPPGPVRPSWFTQVVSANPRVTTKHLTTLGPGEQALARPSSLTMGGPSRKHVHIPEVVTESPRQPFYQSKGQQSGRGDKASLRDRLRRLREAREEQIREQLPAVNRWGVHEPVRFSPGRRAVPSSDSKSLPRQESTASAREATRARQQSDSVQRQRLAAVPLSRYDRMSAQISAQQSAYIQEYAPENSDQVTKERDGRGTRKAPPEEPVGFVPRPILGRAWREEPPTEEPLPPPTTTKVPGKAPTLRKITGGDEEKNRVRAWRPLFIDERGNPRKRGFPYRNKEDAVIAGMSETDDTDMVAFEIERDTVEKEELRKPKRRASLHKFRQSGGTYIEKRQYRQDRERKGGFNIYPYVFPRR